MENTGLFPPSACLLYIFPPYCNQIDCLPLSNSRKWEKLFIIWLFQCYEVQSLNQEAQKSSVTTIYCKIYSTFNWSLIIAAWLVLIYCWVTHTPEPIKIKPIPGEKLLTKDSCSWWQEKQHAQNPIRWMPVWRKTQPSGNGEIKCSHNLSCLI